MYDYKKIHDENPKDEIHLRAYLSARFFNYLLQVIFVGQNYSQSNPTIRKPMHYTVKNAIKHAIENFNNEYTEDEVDFIKMHADPRDIL
jgi:uncharacterized ubiquitin-like protein YukD